MSVKPTFDERTGNCPSNKLCHEQRNKQCSKEKLLPVQNCAYCFALTVFLLAVSNNL
jgi:hypothetical protein